MDEKPLGHVPGEDPRFAKLEADMVGKNDPELATKIAKANAAAEDVASILSGVFKHKVQPATAQAVAPELPSGGTGSALGAEGLDLDLGNGSGNNPPPPSPPPSGGGGNGDFNMDGFLDKYLPRRVIGILLAVAGIIALFINLRVEENRARDSDPVKIERERTAQKNFEAQIEKTRTEREEITRKKEPERWSNPCFIEGKIGQRDSFPGTCRNVVINANAPEYGLLAPREVLRIEGSYAIRSQGMIVCQTERVGESNYSSTSCQEAFGAMSYPREIKIERLGAPITVFFKN